MQPGDRDQQRQWHRPDKFRAVRRAAVRRSRKGWGRRAVSGLLLTDLPPYDLGQLQAVLEEAIQWECRHPRTREEAEMRETFIHRLRQASARVRIAIREPR